MADIFIVIICSVCGVLISLISACLPGVHIYNIMAMFMFGIYSLSGTPIINDVLISLFAGMIVGYAMFNTIPAIILSAPDESALFTVVPGRKYLLRGRGYEAVMITTVGAIAGLFFLLIIFALPVGNFFVFLRQVLSPHFNWIIWCVISFMLLSEWPKGGNKGMSGWKIFFDAWKSIGVGLLTFILSGILGFILFYRSPLPVNVSFQNLMPAFIGLFTLPGLIMNIAGRFIMPEQIYTCSVRDSSSLIKGSVAGLLGGGFAAFFPVVTGGVGGFLAGHATSLRDTESFLVSQGAGKFIYYVGGFIFLFMPGVNMMRGGAAGMLGAYYMPYTAYDYYMVLASVAIAGAVACMLISPVTKYVLKVIKYSGHFYVTIAAFILVVGVVFVVAGTAGLLVMLTAAGIGLLPVLYGARRMNCLGVILLPVACMMSGCGATVAAWLGLL